MLTLRPRSQSVHSRSLTARSRCLGRRTKPTRTRKDACSRRERAGSSQPTTTITTLKQEVAMRSFARVQALTTKFLLASSSLPRTRLGSRCSSALSVKTPTIEARFQCRRISLLSESTECRAAGSASETRLTKRTAAGQASSATSAVPVKHSL